MKRLFDIKKALVLAGVTISSQLGAAEMEEVIVTAQKRAQDAQEVGISINAFTGRNLKQRGIDNINGLAAATPNVQLYDLSGGGVPVVVIRGIGLQNFRINDSPTTGIYVDDVYQVSIAQLESTLFDLDRVEILKGPQGGLYGRNAVGGAMQYISKKPSFEGTEGYASVGYGKYSTLELEGALGGPINDTLAIRVSGRWVNSADTFYRSTAGEGDHGEKNRWAARSILSYQPEGPFSANLKIHGGVDKSEIALYHTIGAFEPSGSNIIPGIADSRLFGNYCAAVLSGGREPNRCIVAGGETPAALGVSGRYDSATSARPRLDSKWWGLSLTGLWEFDSVSVTSITAFDRYDYIRITDQDAVPQNQQLITYRSDIEAWSQEFRVSYDTGGAITGLVGLSYSEDELEENTFLNGGEGLFAALFGTNTFEQPYAQNAEAFSIFGTTTWHQSDRLKLTVEARYTKEDKAFVGGVFFVDRDNFVNRRNGDLIFTDNSDTYEAVTGKLLVEWQASDDILLYGSIARGFKTGGFFGGFALSTPELDPYESEFITAYEIGSKSDWLDGRARVNGSLFYYNRSDVQASGSKNSNGVTIDRLTNIGDVKTFGAEIEATFIPIDALTLNFGIGYTEAEIENSTVLVEDLFSGESVSPDGLNLPNQPKLSFNFFATYEFSLTSDLGAGVQVDYSYRSESDMELVKSREEEAFFQEDGYGLLNLSLFVVSMDDDWRLTARINNALDEEYRTVARGITHGGLYEIWGAPRTWSVELSRNL